jgi:hypothetical protein
MVGKASKRTADLIGCRGRGLWYMVFGKFKPQVQVQAKQVKEAHPKQTPSPSSSPSPPSTNTKHKHAATLHAEMPIPPLTRLAKVSVLSPTTNQWKKISPISGEFGLYIAVSTSTMPLTVYVAGNDIIARHLPPLHGMKVYSRGADMSLKYWDEGAGGIDAGWWKVQVTFDSVDVRREWMSFFQECGIATVDKDEGKRQIFGTAGADAVDLDKLEDADFRRLVVEKLGNAEFQKLVSIYTNLCRIEID